MFIYIYNKPLKAKHDVTKLNLTIPLLSLWCINIDLSIQPMSLIVCMTQVHQHRIYNSQVPCKQISCPQLVHGFGQSSRDCSAPPPYQRDDLSWSLGWVFHGECSSVCDAHCTGPTMNHDARVLIFMIHQSTILHGLSTLRDVEPPSKSTGGFDQWVRP